MNKYQEALDRLVKHSCPQRTSCNDCDMKGYCNRIAKDWIDVLQELVDKATPKKPAFNEDWRDEETTSIYDEDGFINPVVCVCPNCGKNAICVTEYGKYNKCCHECGQAIDWSEE